LAEKIDESKLVREVQYVLEVPFSYAHKGQPVDARFVLLLAPTARNSREAATLKQAFFRAAGGQESEAAEQKGDVRIPTGSEVMVALAMSKDVDLPEVLEVAKKLLTSGVAMIDGEEKLTGPVLDKVSDEDFQAMVGEYLVAFCLASVLSKMRASS